MMEKIKNRKILLFLVIGVFALISLAFLFRLGQDAFLDYDEAEYAKISVQAMRSGNYLTSVLDGDLWFEKPPLQFWLSEGFAKSGLPLEWAFRLPSALAGILTVLLIGLIIFEISGSIGAGIFGAVALTTTGAYLMAAREFKLDALVTMFIVCAVLAFLKGLKNPKWFIWIGIFAGFAVMTKSVIGLFIFPIIFAIGLMYWNLNWLKEKMFWIGVIVGVLIALPWHIYEWIKYGNEFIYSYVIFTIFNRYQNNLLGNNVTELVYFKTLYFYAMPWSALFVLCALYTIIYWKKINQKFKPVLSGSILISLGLFLIFSISKTKVVYYLVPIYPFIAIVVSLCFIDIYQKINKKWIKNIYVACAVVVFAITAWYAIPNGYHRHPKFNEETQFASVEKRIGLFLKSKDVDTIYFDSKLYTQTIRYYADKKVAVLNKDNLPQKPFYIVLFWNTAKNNPFYISLLKNIEPEYAGSFMAVYKIK